ncbi:hypothetical protein CBF34_01710 [Vagococcus penaei]|uniref:Uncharacterized protein n=1 Tax=Vagococcus penaei TaxID=633807 RepID=A0A1Q2D7Q2_9ENTE|nr:DUF1622 domain-containing protein [Vagococcus penaei]AQP54350.1 hypothetical protein BW732_09020 [Vagococcus penaei]RSU06266.1 hypothetical protein CBF34_01710 [Vagococcus penaei]
MEYFHEIIKYIVLLLNSFSIIILLFGVVKAFFDFFGNEFKNGDRFVIAKKNNRIKLYLGSYILLSLEVLIASDIIETIMNPSVDDIFTLAGIVVIRTAISYFLGKEMEHTETD